MTTKAEMIEIIKAENPTLRIGNEHEGYTDLSKSDYETTISDWADARLIKETQIAQIEANVEAKSVLLAKLGITADEAKLLIG